MTVCIAALYDKGKGCVLASDLMTTAHFPIGYEFESDEVEKIAGLADSAYVLISGDVLFTNQVIEAAKAKLLGGGPKSIDELTEIVRTAYQEARRTHVIRTQLEPRGLDINTYYQGQQKLIPAIVQIIDQAFVTYNPRSDVIVAGRDISGCHICTIQNPGESICHDPVGFAAIGSGGPHAVYAIIEGDYKKSLSKDAVEELVKKAKARSEVAPGVGRGTKCLSL